MTKRILSILLSTILVLTMIPSMAFAALGFTGVTLSNEGVVTWNKEADTDKVSDFTVTISTQIKSGSGIASDWVDTTDVLTDVAEKGDGFEGKVDLTKYGVNKMVRVTVAKGGKSYTSAEVNGMEPVEPPINVPNESVDTPNVALSRYAGNVQGQKIVNGLRVEITPNQTPNQPAEYFELTLYKNKEEVDTNKLSTEWPKDAKLAGSTRTVYADSKDKKATVYGYFTDAEFSRDKEYMHYFVKVTTRKNGVKPVEQYFTIDKAPELTGSLNSSLGTAKISGTTVSVNVTGLAANEVFKAYVGAVKNSGNVEFAKTDYVYGQADSSGKTTLSFNLADYVFVKDAIYARVYIETINDTLRYMHSAPVDFVATRNPVETATFTARMDNTGCITFDPKATKAETYDYAVKYKGNVVKQVKGLSVGGNSVLFRNDWGTGLQGKDTPAVTMANLKDFTVTIIGHKYNYADYTAELKANGEVSNEQSLYGSISIILPIAKAYNTASVNVVNLRPLEAHSSLYYSWYLNGVLVSNSQTYQIRPEDIGKTLSVSVTGTQSFRGTVSSTGVFLDGGRPYIKAQPVGYKHYIGDAKQPLTVTATTTGSALKYQWYKDGVAIVGATNASYTPTTEERGKDEYYCVISNTDGTVITDKVVVQNLVRVGVPELKAQKNRTTIKLMWTKADNALKYKVYERKDGKYVHVKTVKNRSLVVKVKPGSKHVYKVKAVNGGCYSYSAAKKFTAKK